VGRFACRLSGPGSHDHAQSQAHSSIGYCDVVRMQVEAGDSRMLPTKKTKASLAPASLNSLFALQCR
jgi:hypothetical protein